MNLNTIDALGQIKFIVRNASGIVLICTLVSYGFMQMFVKPMIKDENQCIKEMIMENNFMLQEMVTVEVREVARQKLEAYRRLHNE